MYTISVSNEQSLLEIEEPFLVRVAEKTLELEGVPRADVGIAVVDDPAIHALNRRFLAHDYPTDVLSFRLDDGDPAADGDEPLEGEIVVSAETAIRRAAEFDWPAGSELVLYVVHGLLHLAGYDDQTDEDRTVMRSHEQAALSACGLRIPN